MINESDTEIGQIVGSNSHIDYVCEVYADIDRKNPPGPEDHEFGQFVYAEKKIAGKDRVFVGVIYDTILMDPEQGRSGPSLAQPDKQKAFNPSYVEEKQVLTGIALLGHANVEDGDLVDINHSIPRQSLEVDDVFKKLSKEDFDDFHRFDDGVQIQYYQRILDVAGGFAEDILSQILDRLKRSFDGEKEALDVIQRNLEWETKMQGVER
jgi:hypothetical protein